MKKNVIVFDTETNGLENCSVLSITAIKIAVDLETVKVEEKDRFERYYYRYPGEEINQSAILVNGLADFVIEKRRSGLKYAKHFVNDFDFINFCKDTEHYVAHNMIFDSKFVPFELKNTFCTKESNIEVLKLESLYGKYKWPRLNETANYYGIELDEDKWHLSSYDAEICKEIFVKMLEKEETREKVIEFLKRG